MCLCPIQRLMVKPELKKDKIVFPDVIYFDNFWPEKNKLDYNSRPKLETFCAGIAFGADDELSRNSSMILWFSDDNVDVSKPHTLTTTHAEEIKFFKNRRIDVKFKDTNTAEECFIKLRLNTIELQEEN